MALQMVPPLWCEYSLLSTNEKKPSLMKGWAFLYLAKPKAYAAIGAETCVELAW